MNSSDHFPYKTMRLALVILAALQTLALTSPLTPPNILEATAVSSSEVDVSWRPGAGDGAGYKIFRNGILVATTTTKTTTYHDSMLAPSTTYTEAVAAYEYAGDISGQSTSASDTTIEALLNTLAAQQPQPSAALPKYFMGPCSSHWSVE